MNGQHHLTLLAAGLLLASGTQVSAAVHYVDLNSTNAKPPYTNWATAANIIQDAVDGAVAGDEVVVTNGFYAVGGRTNSFGGNRVLVDKPLNLVSVNGPQLTIIYGPGWSDMVGDAGARCVFLTSGASLSGFTLTNGYLSSGRGAGVLCAPGAVVSNCVITGNRIGSAPIPIISGPYLFLGGGASSTHFGGTLNNCTLTGNSVSVVSDFGYRSYYSLSAYGGGASGCTLNNCVLTGNWVGATNWYNGTDNTAEAYGGGAYGCTLNNCTLTSNLTAAVTYSWLGETSQGGAAYQSVLNNCISFRNYNYFGGGFYVCEDCYTAAVPGNNWFGNPWFVDFSGGNLRLQSNSPCINAGNNSYVTNSTDLDGNPRIAGGTVDIGAHEYQTPTSVISYAWLQQYGLPTDGSADLTDPDGDGMNNWQEWRCGTDPTNALSTLRLLTPVTAGTNMIVTWQSVAGENYFLQRSTNLTAPPAFVTLATGIQGQAGTTTFVDSNARGAGPFFYRVGVEN